MNSRYWSNRSVSSLAFAGFFVFLQATVAGAFDESIRIGATTMQATEQSRLNNAEAESMDGGTGNSNELALPTRTSVDASSENQGRTIRSLN